MSNLPFVHLHCHSHYSLLDGASKIPDLVERAKALGMPALALTDHGNLYGAVELLREAKNAGIVPIVGLEAYVAPGNRTERRGGGVTGQEHAFHLTLLASDATRVPQSDAALVAFISRGVLLQAANRQRDPRAALGRADLPIRMRFRPSFPTTSCTARRPKPSSSAPGIRRSSAKSSFFVEIQDNGVGIQKECALGRD